MKNIVHDCQPYFCLYTFSLNSMQYYKHSLLNTHSMRSFNKPTFTRSSFSAMAVEVYFKINCYCPKLFSI